MKLEKISEASKKIKKSVKTNIKEAVKSLRVKNAVKKEKKINLSKFFENEADEGNDTEEEHKNMKSSCK